MNEVEKLYKLVGCEKYVCTHKVQKYCDRNGKYSNTSDFTLCLGEDCQKEYKNIVFDEYNACYFSSKKQLELIKCLLTHVADTELIHFEFSDKTLKFFIHSIACAGNDCDTLEDALCSYIYNLWQDLTEAEKEEIKRILENE